MNIPFSLARSRLYALVERGTKNITFEGTGSKLLDRNYPRTLITFDIQKVTNIPQSELSKTGREYTSLCDNLQSEPPRYIYLYE